MQQDESPAIGTIMPASDQIEPRRAPIGARLAWGLCAVSLTLVALGLVYGAWNHSLLAALALEAPNAIVAVSFPVVGALIATHRPRNPIGWLFCTVGVFQGLLIAAEEYGDYALRTAPGTVPGGPLASWVGHWVWAPSVGLLFTFVPLLFPDGRLPSPRWRPVAWLSALSIVLTCGLYAVLLWPLRAVVDREPDELLAGSQAIILNTAFPFMVLCGLACLTALAVRVRRARGLERQQLKWLLFAAAITVVIISLSALVSVLWLLPLLPAIPVAAGIAILRYRLYAIDRIISRTLVYGLLTAILGLGYAGAVLVLGQVSGGVAGNPPSWAVAGATLAVAALFQPARRRIQQVVDRRFNRRKYDAAKTVEAFSGRLRDEVDLDALSAELLAVTDQTMQPTTVFLWLRPAAQAPPGGHWRAS
jgi:thiosulfate reductase cytochrome b subunit